MNNLVFNNVASLLKTTIYAQNASSQIVPLQMDAGNNLLVSIDSGTVAISNTSLTVAGTVTVSEITASVTIGNASLTVAGTVAVSEITEPVTIGNASLTVAGTVAVSEITEPVTIGNASLTVAGTVAVSEITEPVTIGNASLTVAGSVTVAGTVAVSEITEPVTIGNASLTVAGTVAVSEITEPVTIGNASLTVTISASEFTSYTVASQAITGTGVLFNHTDISEVKVASVFLYNNGATPITLSLQISPVDSDALYLNDPSYTDQTLPGNGNLFIPITNFAHYARIQYNMGGSSGTISAYLNAQA